MVGALTPVSPLEARVAIARAVVGATRAPAALGRIILLPHQVHAVARIESAMREFGGALLADETGLGKTYVALDVARRASRPIVVAPAALRAMWRDAMAAAECPVPFVSIEALSRGLVDTGVCDPDLIIVDEAHHVRNRATARYRAMAALTANARVLLLSATPIHNSARDLTALLALFLGSRANVLHAADSARCIVRRAAGATSVASIPIVDAARPLSVTHDERRLDAVLALPPPVPPSDGGDGGVLLVYSLIRQWASSQGALAEALRRRLARATALTAALESGRHPTRHDLCAWTFADGAVQLAFGELFGEPASDAASLRDLALCVRGHVVAVRMLLDELGTGIDPDVERARHLTGLRRLHPRQKIVAFAQYADTVNALYRELRRMPGVAALDANGARVAGGMISRREAIARFAPNAQGASQPGAAHTIDLLLTTDLLSEGVNLQDASVVVHLDLPWTPARLEQRVGRVARIGSRHERVAVYTMQPPASAERIVGVEERLRTKLGATSRTIGVVGTILPSLLAARAPETTSAPQSHEASRRRIAGWGSHAPPAATNTPASDPPRDGLVASVAASARGFLALLERSGEPHLLADIGTGPSDDPGIVLAAIEAAEGEGVELDVTAVAETRATIERWLDSQRVRRELCLVTPMANCAQRQVVERIAAITNRAPTHLRPTIAALAARARSTVTGRFGAGAERVLDELASAQMADEAWLRALTTFGELHSGVTRDPTLDVAALRVLILLGRGT